MIKLKKKLPWLNKWDILIKEDISNMELNLKQISIWEEDLWFFIWTKDWKNIDEYFNWLNYLINQNINNKEYFEKI